MAANSSVIPYLSVLVYDQLQTSRRPILSFRATLTVLVYDLLQTSWRPIPPFPAFLSNLFYDLFQTFTSRNWADPGRIFRQALPVLYSRAGAYSAAKNARYAHPHSRWGAGRRLRQIESPTHVLQLLLFHVILLLRKETGNRIRFFP
jgi:hypothetical protein